MTGLDSKDEARSGGIETRQVWQGLFGPGKACLVEAAQGGDPRGSPFRFSERQLPNGSIVA